MSKRLLFFLLLLPLLGAALWASTPARLERAFVDVDLPRDLDDWLTIREKSVAESFGLVPGTEKRITWFAEGERTTWSVVYLHGFSATRQETAPLSGIVARALGANLFETRLSGHGRERAPLTAVRAEDWLADAAEALAIGAAIGERVVVIGTSTGATLATAMLGDPAMEAVDTLVMLSPNFEPRDPGAAWLTRPAGPLLASLFVGEMRSWEPYNEKQGRYWSTSYPMAAAVEMMRLVDLAEQKLPGTIAQRLLLFYSPDDEVISPTAALAIVENTAAPHKSAIKIRDPGDPSHHVLAGDVLSAATTQEIADDIVAFIERQAP